MKLPLNVKSKIKMAKVVVVKAVIVIEVVPNEKNNHYTHNKTKTIKTVEQMARISPKR